MQDRLGKYAIRGVLGKGAMGTVYDAHDPAIDRRVAIKTLTLPDAADEEAQQELARFRREAQAAGRLAHPNIVGVFDYGETDSLAYIVMEFVDGPSLKSVLDRKEHFAPAQSVRIMEEVLAGLAYSHQRGVVHRDIKPANIMLTGDGQVKIADFGIARIESSSMTQAGTIMGTPAYMSPEQFMGQTVDARTDLYSAGVVLYQMLTGERPFEGSMTAIMHKALNTEPPRPSALSVTAPAPLDAVVARAMGKRPEQRFANAAEFAAALRDASVAGPVDADATMLATPPRAPPPPPPPPPPASMTPVRKGKAGLLAGVAAVLLLAGGGAAYLLLGRAPAPAEVAAVIPPPVVAPPTLPPDTPPAPEPAPQPVVAPPAAPAPPAPALLRAALARLADAAGCALLTVEVGDAGDAHVRGIARAADAAALRRSLAEAAAGAPLDWQVSDFDGPYCPVLDAIRTVARPTPGRPALELGLKDNPPRLANNASIVPRLTLPDFPAYLLLTYFSSDGSMMQMQPSPQVKQVDLRSPDGRSQSLKLGNAEDAARQFPARAVVTLGDPASAGVRPEEIGWTAAEPFGHDLLLAVASSVPLFTAPRPADDRPEAYLAALKAAIEAAQRRGGSVTARVRLLELVP